MISRLNKFIDTLSNYFAHRKGLLPLMGSVLIIVNLIIQFTLPGWLSESNLFLHVGIILAIIGFMLAWAL